MIGFRTLTIAVVLIGRVALSAPTVDDLEIEDVGDPDLLPIILVEKRTSDDESRRQPIADHLQVYRTAGPGQDTAITVRATNTILNRDNPAVFSYVNQATQTVIDDDPVRATISSFAFYFDGVAGKKSLISGAYRNDSALAIRIIPGSDRSDILFLNSGVDHSGNERWEPKVQVLLVEDYDFDGHQEAFIYVGPGRDLKPRELFCVDPQRLVIEWSLPVASIITPGSLHSCRDSLDPGVIFTTANVKNGVVDDLFDDSFSYLARINRRGEPTLRRIISEEHSGDGLWPAERDGLFYLVYALPLVPPGDTAALPEQQFRLSRIDCRGQEQVSVEVPCRLSDAWISEYGRNRQPCLYTLSSTGVVSVYDTSLALLARSKETRLRRFLDTLRIEGQDRPALLFATSSSLGLYSHDFAALGFFAKPYTKYHPLAFGEYGETVRFIVSLRDRDSTIELQRRPLLGYFRILFWKYQNTILIVLTLLALALVVVNAFRQRAVRRLRESVSRFREMADLLPQGVFEIGMDSNVTFGNREALSMFGYTQADLDSGLCVFNVVIPEDRERLKTNIEKVIRGEKTGGLEYTALTKSGTTFPILTYSDGACRNGRIAGIRGVVMDISEQKRTAEALIESENKWRSLVENIPDIIFTVNAEGRILTLDRVMGHIAGDRVIDSSVYDHVAEEHQESLRKAVADVFMTGRPGSLEVLSIGPDGPGTAWYQTRIVPMVKEGRVDRLEFINTDITERKKAQEALQQSEENYRSLVESAGEAIFTVDYEGVYKFVNSVAARRLRHKPEEITGRSMTEFFPPEIARRQMQSIRMVFDSGEGRTIESVTQLGDRKRWYRTSLQPVRNHEGETVSVLGIGRDISEAVETQRALGSERDFVRSMLDTSNSLVFCLDNKARITVFNKECERVTGYKREEVIGKVWPELFVPKECHRHTSENFADWVRQHPSDSFEDPIITRNGELRIILWSNSAMFHPDSDELTAIAVGQDITERKRAEKKLQESERKYRSLVEHSLQAIFIIQRDRVVLANRRLAELLGAEEEDLNGASLYDILSFVVEPQVQQRLRDAHFALLSGEKVDDYMELLVRRGQGAGIWVEAMAHRVTYEGEPAVIIVLIDISARKRAEAQMQALNQEKYQQAQRIAGGFAHEIRNALFPAEGALYRLVGGGQEGFSESARDVKRYSAAAAAAVSRALDITDLISYYTGLDAGHSPEPVALGALVREVLEANEFALEDLGVDVRTTALEGVQVVSNRQQLYLAFNNLLLNSLDALTEQARPAILVEAAAAEPGLVKVTFGDNGCGICPEDLDKIFDTFFSSKPNKGTGLGLAMSRQIIEMYGGSIRVESRPGEWTRFEIGLRAAKPDGQTQQKTQLM